MVKRSKKRGVPHKARKGLVDTRGSKLSPNIKRIVVGTPVQDQCSSWFAFDLARLTGFTTGQVPNTMLHLFFNGGTYLGPQRDEIAAAAVKLDASHVMFIDSDMRFPKEALAALLAHDKDIVGANYVRRRPPHYPTAWANGDYVWTYEDSQGLVPVDHVGLGLMLIKTEVFRAIQEPWFPIGHDGDGSFRGEDVRFFEKARLAGYEVLIDQELSKYVLHIGNIEYNYIHGLDAKEWMTRVAEEEANGSDNDVRDAAG